MNSITNNQDITNATTAQLVEFYNANSGRPAIKKFVNRATAELRVTKLLATLAAEQPKPKAKKSSSGTKSLLSPEQRAAAIAKSWQDPETAAARSARNGCKVGGVVYASVPKAFAELGLDMKKHQRVRRQMVLDGHVTFEGHRFTLVRDV